MRILKALLVLGFILMYMNNSLALSSDINEEYKGLTTVVVKLEGNIIEPISKEQIEFKRKNVGVPIEYDIGKINGDYYIWFVTPKVENDTNYTLIIKDVFVQEFGLNKKATLNENFSVIKNISDYYIKPGFIYTRGNYSLDIYSNIDNEFAINCDFPTSKEIIIKPGKNEIFFYTDHIKTSVLKTVKVGSYQLIVYIEKEGEIQIIKNNSIVVNPQGISVVKETGSKDLKYFFEVINIGANTIENIYLVYDDKQINIEPDEKLDLAAGAEIKYNITLKKEKNTSEEVKIYSKENNISEYFSINVKFVDYISNVNYTLLNQTLTQNNSGEYYCQEMGGRTCMEGQNCSGQLIGTKGNVSCCIGKCSLIENESESSSWIGYLIIAGTIIAIAYGFVQYRKAKPSKTILEKTVEEGKMKHP